MKSDIERFRREGISKYEKKPNELKVVFLGERVGKTSLIRNFMRNYKLNPTQQKTTSNEFHEKEHQVNEKSYDLKIVDTPGGFEDGRMKKNSFQTW